MTDKEITFIVKNIDKAFTAELKVRVSALGLMESECSGCSDNEPKIIRLMSERIGQGPEHIKHYCLDHGKQSLDQLYEPDFLINNKHELLGDLYNYLKKDEQELEKHFEEEEKKTQYVNPGSQSAVRTSDKALCLNTDCQAEINTENKALHLDCEKCKQTTIDRMRSGEWIRTTRGGWIKKESDKREDDDKEKVSELDEIRKKVHEELTNKNKEKETGEKAQFSIPLRKMGDKPGDKEIIEALAKQGQEEQVKSEQDKHTYFNTDFPKAEQNNMETLKREPLEELSKEDQATIKASGILKEPEKTTTLKADWSLLTKEEINTLDSRARWNLRAKRQRALARGESIPTTTEKQPEPEIKIKSQSNKLLTLDPSGTEQTGIITEVNDKEFKEFGDVACFHLKEKFWQFFNSKALPHLGKSTSWFFNLNIKKKDKCLCECLNDIRQARTTGETNDKHNYKQMYLDLKKTKEIDYKGHRQELLTLAKENRELKTVIQKKTNENAKINRALILVYNKGKDDWQKISKLFIEHKPKGNNKNYDPKK